MTEINKNKVVFPMLGSDLAYFLTALIKNPDGICEPILLPDDLRFLNFEQILKILARLFGWPISYEYYDMDLKRYYIEWGLLDVSDHKDMQEFLRVNEQPRFRRTQLLNLDLALKGRV